jgi:hypothetical protein
MEHPKPLGAKPRKPKPEDWKMSSILPAATVTTKTWQSPIRLDQGAYGTCVFNAWTHFLTCSPIQHPDRVLLDPSKQPSYAQMGSSAYWPNGWDKDPIAAELYAVRGYDAIHDGVLEPLDPERDDGANTVDGAVILKRRGIITGYYRAESVDEVIQAVLTKSPVVFASAWYRSMDSTPKLYDNVPYVDVDVSSGIRGYHAYVIDAANVAPTAGPPFGVILNSWGKFSWGRGGRARVSIEDLSTLYIGNAWIATGEVA